MIQRGRHCSDPFERGQILNEQQALVMRELALDETKLASFFNWASEL